jgi:glycosyltransferase involved in cell wall biosynthesis
MKICHVITRMIVGGAQENTLLTCQGHLEKGHDVTLVTGPSPGPEGELLKQGVPDGLRVVVFPELVRQISPSNDLKAKKKLIEFFKQEKFDVVHTHASKAGIIGRVAAKAADVPFIVHTVHGLPFHKYQNPFSNAIYILMERYAAKKCDKIFAVAKAIVEQCVNAHVAPENKFKVVYSGMHLEAFMNAQPEEELRQKLGIPEGAPVVGKVARLFELKGHDDLLKAAPELVAANPEIRFLIVGDGILRPKFEAQIAQMGLQKNFIFTGLVPPTEVCRYIALMDILVHLSLREGLPRSVVQGMAAGKPVIAYPLDGTPEVISSGTTGYLIEPHDTENLVQNINILIRNAQRRHEVGRKAKERVADLFDWRRMADILEKEYIHGLRLKGVLPPEENHTVKIK